MFTYFVLKSQILKRGFPRFEGSYGFPIYLLEGKRRFPKANNQRFGVAKTFLAIAKSFTENFLLRKVFRKLFRS